LSGRLHVALVAPGGLGPDGQHRTIPALRDLVIDLARDADVEVFLLRQEREAVSYDAFGAKIHAVGEPAPGRAVRVRGTLRLLHALRRVHKRKPFDLFHGLWTQESGAAAAIAARLTGRNAVASVMGGELEAMPEIGFGGESSAFGRRMNRLCLDLAARVTAGSEPIEETLRARLQGDPRGRIVRAPLGIDTSLFLPHPHPERHTPLLLAAGSINRVKDHESLFEAFRRVRRKRPARLLVAGEDTLQGELELKTREAGLTSELVWFGFALPREMPALYAEADLFVHTSRFESQGVVLLEAAASGLPIVSTAVGIAQEMERAGAARIVRPADPDHIADEIVRLLDDPAARAALGEKARLFAAGFDRTITSAKFLEIYQELRRE